jgi:hypothetical protein
MISLGRLSDPILEPPSSDVQASTIPSEAGGRARESEPNIALCWDDNDNYSRITIERKTFRTARGMKGHIAVAVQFRNEPKPPRKICRAPNVRGEVLYYDLDNPDVIDMRTGACWVDEPSSTVSFDVGTTHYLVLGVFVRVDGGYNFQAFDSDDPEEFWAMTGGADPGFKIIVRLNWGDHHEFGVETTLELKIETRDANNRFFELFHLSQDASGSSIKTSRGRVHLFPP